MGQKTHPTGLRTGIIRTWESKWFARKGQYRENLLEDIALRKFILKDLHDADVSRRPVNKKCAVGPCSAQGRVGTLVVF